ncbi:hypothetical protein WH367_10890 [Comamonas sp. MYb21]|uniref:hypothetical protein n=1 Tax=Comamonas sp. MYb21 TaxID=1848648 RepID=UPI0030A6F76D
MKTIHLPALRSALTTSFERGEAFQLDRSEEGHLVGGVFYKPRMTRLWLVTYPGHGHKMLFDVQSYVMMEGNVEAARRMEARASRQGFVQAFDSIGMLDLDGYKFGFNPT